MNNPLDFGGKVVLVTGGGKGIGKGIAEAFLAAGAQVVVCGRSQPDALPSCAGREALFTACDVRDYDQIEACVDFIRSRCGRLDVLVNNAGGAPHADAATASPRFSEAIIRLNLIAPLNFSQVANRLMQTQAEGGSIINIASVSTLRPSPGTAAYGGCQGGTGQPRQFTGGGMGAPGAGERRDCGPDPNGAIRPPLR
jgi:NAD(P)-dependent dehydrogenase (short-subunit alcohol dehydrogenase family)